ncbi:MAG: hypothetical protein HQK51_14330 [Oligoflexia bacterium]|nr:hypothetical protein [Oligoflexia bacterium]
MAKDESCNQKQNTPLANEINNFKNKIDPLIEEYLKREYINGAMVGIIDGEKSYFYSYGKTIAGSNEKK